MEKVPVAKDEEYEDKEGLSRVQSNPRLNREIFSDSRTAAPCGPNLESEFALFGFRMRKLWSKY